MKNAMEADADWEDEFLLELIDHGLDWDTAEACAAEAMAHCAEVGERPDQAFGDAKQYGERIAAGRIPASQRARTDYSGKLTMDEHWGAPLMLPGYYLLIGGIVMWIESGLWLDVSVAGLVFTTLLGFMFAVIGGAQALRSAGRCGRSPSPGCVALSMSVPAAFAAFGLPHAVLTRIPSPALLPAGALIIWLGTLMQRPGIGGTQGLRIPPPVLPAQSCDVEHRGGHRALAAPPRRSAPRTARGPSRRGRRLVAEARSHLEATGTPPEEEFGDVEQYALSLVEGGVRRPAR